MKPRAWLRAVDTPLASNVEVAEAASPHAGAVTSEIAAILALHLAVALAAACALAELGVG